ncbi:cysteine proteinase inhibitor 3 isoform X3 [Triticum aestivum]|nr:cysteine proteinase inhibitor 3 isoform X3 [Aegilops tauschii subsp. strangulata]XP_044450366.1 cysteine proteinase inhibitor 3-like isoform X3 [Triticum aestivum]
MARRCGCSVGATLLALSLAVLLAASAVPGAAGFHLGGDESGLVRGMLAAVRERAEAEDAARFAVAEHNRKQGSALEFTRVVNAKRQVVAGTLHDLMVEVVDSGKKSMYKAKLSSSCLFKPTWHQRCTATRILDYLLTHPLLRHTRCEGSFHGVWNWKA